MQDSYVVTRFEVIDHVHGEGRMVLSSTDEPPIRVSVQLQDEGRTLKIFMTEFR